MLKERGRERHPMGWKGQPAHGVRLGDGGLGSGEEVGIDEIVARHGLGGYDGMVREKMGPAKAKVWNSPRSPQGSTGAGRAATGRVEGAAGEGGVEGAGVDAGEVCAQAGGDHLAGELGGREPRSGVQTGKMGSRPVGASGDAIGADVFQRKRSPKAMP